MSREIEGACGTHERIKIICAVVYGNNWGGVSLFKNLGGTSQLSATLDSLTRVRIGVQFPIPSRSYFALFRCIIGAIITYYFNSSKTRPL